MIDCLGRHDYEAEESGVDNEGVTTRRESAGQTQGQEVGVVVLGAWSPTTNLSTPRKQPEKVAFVQPIERLKDSISSHGGEPSFDRGQAPASTIGG